MYITHIITIHILSSERGPNVGWGKDLWSVGGHLARAVQQGAGYAYKVISYWSGSLLILSQVKVEQKVH